MNIADRYLLDNLREIKFNGVTDLNGKVRPKYESDGEPAHSKYITFVHEIYDLSKGEFPIPTLRPLAFFSALREIFAFYQEQTNDIQIMKEKYNLHWWQSWNVGDDTIGQRYGHTVKRYDLMNKLLQIFAEDMFSRRKMMSLWQEQEFEDERKGLKPCFFLTNWEVRELEDGIYLDVHLTSRSSDYSVAGAINRVQYVALMMMVAKMFGFKLGKFSVFTSNLHYYLRHQDQVDELLSRTPSKKQPYIKLNAPDGTNFYDIKISDFELVDFECDYPQLEFELGI